MGEEEHSLRSSEWVKVLMKTRSDKCLYLCVIHFSIKGETWRIMSKCSNELLV